MPSGMAITIATTIAATASSAVRPSRCPISRATGVLYRNDVPRSPCDQPTQEAAVLRRAAVDRDRAWCAARQIAAGGADSPSIASAGSPGTRWISANTSVATPSSTGIVSSNRRTRYRSTGPAMIAATRLASGNSGRACRVAILEPEPPHGLRQALPREAQLVGRRRPTPARGARAPRRPARRSKTRRAASSDTHARRRDARARPSTCATCRGADAPARRRDERQAAR